MLRRKGGHILRRTLELEVEGQSKEGRLDRTLKKQVEERMKDEAWLKQICVLLSKWIVGINQIVTRLWLIRPPSVVGATTRFNALICLSV